MDTAERIDRAKARLEEGRTVALRAREAGPPCTKCCHLITITGPGETWHEKPLCGHLAYTKQAFDAVSGRLEQSTQVPAAMARAENGLCGPEALLFDPGGNGFKRWIRPYSSALYWIFAYLWSSLILWAMVFGSLRHWLEAS